MDRGRSGGTGAATSGLGVRVKTESPFPKYARTRAHGAPRESFCSVPAASPSGQARDRPGLSFPTCGAGSRQNWAERKTSAF